MAQEFTHDAKNMLLNSVRFEHGNTRELITSFPVARKETATAATI